jgi:membrane-associated phospholipid phosphatase
MKFPARSSVTAALVFILASALSTPAGAQVTSTQPVSSTPASLGEPSQSSIGAPTRGLFSDLLSDFRRLPSSESLTILSIGGATALAGHQFDTRVTQTFSTSTRLGSVAGTGNALGSMQVQLGTALATFALGKATDNARVTALGSDLFRAQVVTQTMTQGLKLIAGRTRPDGTSYSFPSGHTSSAFATATVVQRHFGWKAGIPAYGMASWVAASRVQVKRHYLSDVAFGAALGIVAGRTVTIGRGETRFAVAPAVAPGGAGVNFTWVGKN